MAFKRVDTPDIYLAFLSLTATHHLGRLLSRDVRDAASFDPAVRAVWLLKDPSTAVDRPDRRRLRAIAHLCLGVRDTMLPV